jgi:hypothetical protein
MHISMSNLKAMFQRPLHALVGGLCISLIGPMGIESHAASTILSTGFESPFATGALQGQQGWVTAGSGGSTATVQSSIVNSGSQAVQVVKAGAPNTDRRWAVPVSGFPTQRYVIVDWDMRVSQPTNMTAFGPFFGVESYDADIAPYLLGSLGVDATTGDVLYQSQDDGVLAESGTAVTFDQWHHFRIVLDFHTDSYRGFVNGALVSTTGFVDRGYGLDNFTDADISTFAAAADPTSQSLSASAVFDNFVIRDGLLGDYNLDGAVTAADYQQWRTTFGNSVSPASNFADGNSNGVVDAADYVIWRNNLGASVVSGAGAGSALESVVVPEPGVWLLFLGSLPCLLRLRGTR